MAKPAIHTHSERDDTLALSTCSACKTSQLCTKTHLCPVLAVVVVVGAAPEKTLTGMLRLAKSYLSPQAACYEYQSTDDMRTTTSAKFESAEGMTDVYIYLSQNTQKRKCYSRRMCNSAFRVPPFSIPQVIKHRRAPDIWQIAWRLYTAANVILPLLNQLFLEFSRVLSASHRSNSKRPERTFANRFHGDVYVCG